MMTKENNVCYRIRHKETKKYFTSHSGQKTIWTRKPCLDNMCLTFDKSKYEIIKFELKDGEVC